MRCLGTDRSRERLELEPFAVRTYSPLVSVDWQRLQGSISGLTGEVLMSPLDGDRLFPASASNDSGELSKLALHAHH
jgi:hypothetical protein